MEYINLAASEGIKSSFLSDCDSIIYDSKYLDTTSLKINSNSYTSETNSLTVEDIDDDSTRIDFNADIYVNGEKLEDIIKRIVSEISNNNHNISEEIELDEEMMI